MCTSLSLSHPPLSPTHPHIRDELIEWFVRLQLSDYDVMYHISLEGAWLDKVDRRYSWLKRTLVNYQDECVSIFPPEWGIPERMCVKFCNMTRYLLVVVRLSLVLSIQCHSIVTPPPPPPPTPTPPQI